MSASYPPVGCLASLIVRDIKVLEMGVHSSWDGHSRSEPQRLSMMPPSERHWAAQAIMNFPSGHNEFIELETRLATTHGREDSKLPNTAPFLEQMQGKRARGERSGLRPPSPKVLEQPHPIGAVFNDKSFEMT